MSNITIQLPVTCVTITIGVILNNSKHDGNYKLYCAPGRVTQHIYSDDGIEHNKAYNMIEKAATLKK